MRISKLWVLLTLVLCQIAAAQIETLVRAVETAPTNIRFPSADGGTLVFKPCSEKCDADYVRVKLTAATSYRFNGEQVNFADFLNNFMLRRNSDESYALVTYDVQSKTVTAIELAE